MNSTRPAQAAGPPPEPARRAVGPAAASGAANRRAPVPLPRAGRGVQVPRPQHVDLLQPLVPLVPAAHHSGHRPHHPPAPPLADPQRPVLLGSQPPARPVTRSNRSFLSRRLVPQSSYGFHDRREPGCSTRSRGLCMSSSGSAFRGHMRGSILA